MIFIVFLLLKTKPIYIYLAYISFPDYCIQLKVVGFKSQQRQVFLEKKKKQCTSRNCLPITWKAIVKPLQPTMLSALLILLKFNSPAIVHQCLWLRRDSCESLYVCLLKSLDPKFPFFDYIFYYSIEILLTITGFFIDLISEPIFLPTILQLCVLISTRNSLFYDFDDQLCINF